MMEFIEPPFIILRIESSCEDRTIWHPVICLSITFSPPPITQSSTISALFPIFLVQKFGNLKKSRTFAPRLRDNATAQSGTRKFGWVAETTSLLNWRTGLPYRGFESPSFRIWRFHLMVRIHASHAWYTGSIPVGATKHVLWVFTSLKDVFFMLLIISIIKQPTWRRLGNI